MVEKNTTINPLRSHFRVDLRLVIEAPSAEAAREKIMTLLEPDFIKHSEIGDADSVLVSWERGE